MEQRATKAKNRSGLDLEFPPLSKTVREVNRLVRSGDAGTDELAEVISTDPMMAATVLRRVNSAYFGMRREVSDLKKAVYLLGFGDVSNLVLTASFLRLTDLVSHRGARRLFGDLMQLSLGSAIYARLIAECLKIGDAALAYSAGLMHTAGRVVLLFNYPDEYTPLCRPGTSMPFPGASVERAHIGIDHAAAGGLALTEWQMPAALVELVSCLEAPGRIQDVNTRELALCVSVGVAATEQLCLRQQEGLAFEAKAALHVLSRLHGQMSSTVVDRINADRDAVNAQIAEIAGEMTGG